MGHYAEIALLRHSRATDRLYTYEIPDPLVGEVVVGSRVIVSFGRGETPVEAYVMSVGHQPPDYAVKPIRALFEAPHSVEVWLQLDGHRGFDVFLGHEVMLLPREQP